MPTSEFDGGFRTRIQANRASGLGVLLASIEIMRPDVETILLAEPREKI